jgi:hypothetical protein
MRQRQRYRRRFGQNLQHWRSWRLRASPDTKRPQSPAAIPAAVWAVHLYIHPSEAD